MSRPRNPTKRVRVKLDFVLILPRETPSIPFGGREDIHPVLLAACRAALARIRKSTYGRTILKRDEEAFLAGGGRMQVGLDNRPVKGGAS